MSAGSTSRRWPVIAIAVIGFGLALAPVAFQMFSRTPRGGDMIDGFKPYMSDQRIDRFRADLATIDAAHIQSAALAERFPQSSAGTSPAVRTFDQQWPGIRDDMGSMLDTMQANIGHYRGVAALPPFVLFPWFFVIPGVLVGSVAVWSLRRDRITGPGRGRRIALIALAVGLVAAPAVFQMFTRAPGGSRMIDDFRPFMTTAKVTRIQGYFLTIGNAEGDLRRIVLPELSAKGSVRSDEIGAVTTLNHQWPAISSGMAPMIGAMADNVGNFNAVAALPPFWLFPWFFVAPGVLIGALVLVASPRSARAEERAMTPATELERVG